MTVQDIGMVGCTPGAADRPQIRFYTGQEFLDPCVNALAEWPAQVSQEGFDGVLMMFGTSGLERQFDGQWIGPCHPSYDAWLQASLEAHMRALQQQRRQRVDHPGSVQPSPERGQPRREGGGGPSDRLPEPHLRGRAGGVGNVAVIDLRSLICPAGAECTTEIDGIELRPDGLHFAGDGADVDRPVAPAPARCAPG